MLAYPALTAGFAHCFHTLSKELGIAVGQEVDNRGGVGLGAADVLLASLGGDERPAMTVSGKF